MRPVLRSVRLPVPLDKALRALAERQGISVYATLQLSVKTGVAVLAAPPAQDTTTREVVAELASVSTGLIDIERILDRTLFATCAAYCYARNAAMGVRKTDDAVTAEINAAYERQRQFSREERP